MFDGVVITIGPGELIDRLSILSLKARYAQSPALETAVRQQIAILQAKRHDLSDSEDLRALEKRLHDVNSELWSVEDDLRDPALLNAEFCALARRVPVLNDTRAGLKEEIDLHLGWATTETKCYGTT